MGHTKMHFSAKCNSGRVAIQWFHIKHYLDYQFTKIQPYTFRVQKCVFLHDTRLWFPDYKSTNVSYCATDNFTPVLLCYMWIFIGYTYYLFFVHLFVYLFNYSYYPSSVCIWFISYPYPNVCIFLQHRQLNSYIIL